MAQPEAKDTASAPTRAPDDPTEPETGAATRGRPSDAAEADRPFVSVVIPVYNDLDRLEACLAALEKETYPADRFEVLVVDNGSDVPMESAAADFDHVRVVHERRKGSYQARNRGIEQARGDVIAFTDADCIPSPHWLEEGVERLTSVERCGFVAGKIDLFEERPSLPTACERYDQLFYLDQRVAVERGGYGATANLFTFRRVIDDVGPFDGTLTSSGDKEWGNRVRARDYRIAYGHEAVVRHPARTDLRALVRRVVRITGGLHSIRSEASDGNRLTPYWQELKMWKPPLSKVLNILFGDTSRKLSGPYERAKVAGLALLLHYVRRLEFARLMLGGSPRNW